MRGLGSLVAAMVLALLPAGGGALRAETPEPGLREQEWSLAAANRSFDGRRFEQALAEFEAAARVGPAPLPAEGLRRWGISASESGWQLAAFVRLSQYLQVEPAADDRGELEARVTRARETLLKAAARRSRVVATIERRPDEDSRGERHVVRAVGRDGRATVEGLSGFRIHAPLWERAQEVELGAYLELVRRLLDSAAVLADLPSQTFDANAPGPRRAVLLRLVIGEEERTLQALRGGTHDRLREIAGWVLDFARTAPAGP